MTHNRWSDEEAPVGDDLDLRVYTSRLLGADPCLVLHGGGNTSIKRDETTVMGRPERRIYVKGSGWDLATIERGGFSGMRLEPLLELATLDTLDDLVMARELASMRLDSASPAPSVESILHAILPYRYVDHTHADAVVTLTNTVHGIDLVREVFGDDVAVLPYAMPGFDLARLAARELPGMLGAQSVGLVLMNHGIFTFGDSARESYERMIALVTRAEDALRTRAPRAVQAAQSRGSAEDVLHLARSGDRLARARVRSEVSAAAGVSMVLVSSHDPVALAFAQASDVATISQHGPATPDHVIWTKPTPLLGRDVEGFGAAYRNYFEAGAQRASTEVTMLDVAPRVILDPELGMLTAGLTARGAQAVGEIYRHTIDIIRDAEALGGYRSLSPEDQFDVEYWDLEQAKVRRAAAPREQSGRVVLVTGAAGGIGRACASRFLAEGAAVIGLDLTSGIGETFDSPAWLGLQCDLTDLQAVSDALDAAVFAFGGVDAVVLNAGIFPLTRPLSELPAAEWRRVMDVNLDAAVELLRELHPLLRLSPTGGQVLVIGSKNVAAPGPGAVAYSASKAALTQVARVLALEWAPDRIRVNIIHPDAVFDTGIWTAQLLADRAQHYGMTVEQYKRRNLLGVEITSDDVARLCVAMAGHTFAKTTGAQVPIDGGNDRVI